MMSKNQTIYSSVLSVAARARNESMVRLLIQYGANPCHVNPDLTSPLQYAVCLNDTSITRWMIQQGANVNHQDGDGVTPLHTATLCSDLPVDNKTDVIWCLIQQGANINQPDSFGTTPLHQVTKLCSYSIFTMCLKFGGDLAIRNFKDETTLHFAARNKNLDVLIFLLDNNELNKVDERNYGGLTPLHYAAESGNTRACDFLISDGADINAKSDEGNSPLFLATRARYAKTMKLLLRRGAGLDESVMDAVEHMRCDEITMTLIRHLAKLQYLGIIIAASDFDRVKAKHELYSYLRLCDCELREMETLKFYGDISMLDILTMSRKILAGYARNRKLVRVFEELTGILKFPNYGEEVKLRFKEEVELQNVMHNASVALKNALGFNSSRHVVVQRILSHMDIRDLYFLAWESGEINEGDESESEDSEIDEVIKLINVIKENYFINDNKNK